MLNCNWLNGLRGCLGVLRRRRRQSLLAFSERLENRSLLTTFALMSTELSLADARPDDSFDSEDCLTADESAAVEISASQTDDFPVFDPVNFPDSFFQTILPAAAVQPVTESGTDDIPEHGDRSSDVVSDNHQIDFLFRAEAIAALESNIIIFPAVVPLPEIPADTLPLIPADTPADESAEDGDPEDETAYPITSIEPLRISPQHTRLIETLRRQPRPEHPSRDIRIEYPLTTPQAVARPDILLGGSQHPGNQTQSDTRNIDTSVPGKISVTAEDSEEQSGNRTARHDPEVPGRSDERRETVINSLFENRNGKPGDVQQTAGEKLTSSRPEETPAPPRVNPVPLTADGQLLLKPARESSRPVPPPLPEPADDGSTSALDPGVSPVVSAAAFATVPAGWKARLRKRLRYWQAVLA